LGKMKQKRSLVSCLMR